MLDSLVRLVGLLIHAGEFLIVLNLLSLTVALLTRRVRSLSVGVLPIKIAHSWPPFDTLRVGIKRKIK